LSRRAHISVPCSYISPRRRDGFRPCRRSPALARRGRFLARRRAAAGERLRQFARIRRGNSHRLPRESAVRPIRRPCAVARPRSVRGAPSKRFFDVGICEAHGGGFRGGPRQAAFRPFFAVYSTFPSGRRLRRMMTVCRSYPRFCIDRAGVVGSDGRRTHVSRYPCCDVCRDPRSCNLATRRLAAMLRTRCHNVPVAIRYPRTPSRPCKSAPSAPLPFGEPRSFEASRRHGRRLDWALGELVPLACETAECLAVRGTRGRRERPAM
jgi:hypothetical protein